MAEAEPDEAAPHFDFDIKHNDYQKDFLVILKVIRPDWKEAEVTFEELPKQLGHGLFNTMVRCYRNSFPQDAIMVRIHYDHEMLRAFIDRKVEPTVIKYLHARGCAPKILATFQTGFCYEFIPGEVLRCWRLQEEPIWRGVAEELAKIHCGDLEYPPKLVKECHAQLSGMGTLRKDFPDKLEDPEKHERFKEAFPDRETLEKDTKAVWDQVQRTEPLIVLCHNDTRAENVVWNPETEVVKLVDFEGVMYNYQASEIASHFLRFGGFQPIDFNLIPNEEFQLKWLRTYLEKYYSLKGRGIDEVTNKDVRKLYVQVSYFYLLFLIMSGVGGVIAETLNVISHREIDLLRFGIDSIRQFYKEKDRIMSMQMPD